MMPVRRWREQNNMMKITDSQDSSIPAYVKANLEYYLSHEAEDPERFGPVIDDICRRWNI